MSKAKLKSNSSVATAKSSKQSGIEQATVYTDCLASAALAMGRLHSGLDTCTLMEILSKSADKVQAGGLDEIEQMLITQAKALDFFFYQILGKLADAQGIKSIQAFTDIALRAQNQSRKTLSTLAEIKHPRRTTFINQQNNAVNQQVNNAQEVGNFQNHKKVANELIDNEVVYGAKNLNVGATFTAIPSNTVSETVGAFNRTQNTTGKGY